MSDEQEQAVFTSVIINDNFTVYDGYLDEEFKDSIYYTHPDEEITIIVYRASTREHVEEAARRFIASQKK